MCASSSQYYAVLGAATALAVLTRQHLRWVAGVCAVLFAVSLFIHAAVNRATDQGKKSCSAVHGLSIVVNMGQLVALLVVLWQAV
jgi:hypothetical protein